MQKPKVVQNKFTPKNPRKTKKTRPHNRGSSNSGKQRLFPSRKS